MSNYAYTFGVTKEQHEKFEKWRQSHEKKYTGAIGGRYTFSFHGTSLGEVVKVKDEVTGQECDLTEYGDW